MATIGRWMAVGGPEYYQIISQTARQVGCAIGKCDVPVRTVSPVFIRRSDLWMSYRTADSLCARITVRLLSPFHQKQTHMDFLLPAK